MKIDPEQTTETTPNERTRFLMDACKIKDTKANYRWVYSEINNAVQHEREECARIARDIEFGEKNRPGGETAYKILMEIRKRDSRGWFDEPRSVRIPADA